MWQEVRVLVRHVKWFTLVVETQKWLMVQDFTQTSARWIEVGTDLCMQPSDVLVKDVSLASKHLFDLLGFEVADLFLSLEPIPIPIDHQFSLLRVV